MEKPYFIMLYKSNGEGAIPMTDEDDNVVFFETEEKALEAGNESRYAQAFGYEIFNMDNVK